MKEYSFLIPYIPYVIGAMTGYCLFLYNLESKDMGNIIFRVDANNIKKINYKGIFHYMINPFRSKVLWNHQFLSINWLVMTIAFSLYIGTICNIVNMLYF